MIRGTGWLLPILAVTAWLACIVLPAVMATLSLSSDAGNHVDTRPAVELLVTSVIWAAAVAAGAAIIGWIPGRLLGRAMTAGGSTRFLFIASLTFVPIMLPSYIVFYAWWQSWPADSALHQWVLKHGLMQSARQVTLFIGLVCWSWPLVNWCVAGQSLDVSRRREELLLIDGAGWTRRAIDRLRRDSRGVLIGTLLVFLATLANTTCFDLAEVFTFANELRAIQALNASPRDVMIAAAPAILISVIGGVLVWRLLAPSSRSRYTPGAGAMNQWYRCPARDWFLFTIIWLISVALPAGLFLWNILDEASALGRDALAPFTEFFTLYRGSAINTILYAALSGAIGSVIAAGLVFLWLDDRRGVRRVAGVIGLTWLILAMCPATIIGLALLRSYNQPVFKDVIAGSPAMLTLGHLACFGFIAALLARWAALREPRQLADLRRVDGAQSLFALFEAFRPRVLAAMLATFAAVFVLSIGEIPVTAMVHPPYRAGYGPLALTLLNDMHYQRPQTVLVASIGMFVFAIIASIVVAMIWRTISRTTSRVAA